MLLTDSKITRTVALYLVLRYNASLKRLIVMFANEGGFSMKKLSRVFSMIMLLGLISMTFVPGAMADTAFCGICNKNTTWKIYCTGEFAGESAWNQHSYGAKTCDYKYLYNKSVQACSNCKKNKASYSKKHQEKVTHLVCAQGGRMCPYTRI